jgi:hypothetical protein
VVSLADPYGRIVEFLDRSNYLFLQLIPQLYSRAEMSGQHHAPAALSQGKQPQAPIGQEVGWAPEPVWTIWRSENS